MLSQSEAQNDDEIERSLTEQPYVFGDTSDEEVKFVNLIFFTFSVILLLLFVGILALFHYCLFGDFICKLFNNIWGG